LRFVNDTLNLELDDSIMRRMDAKAVEGERGEDFV